VRLGIVLDHPGFEPYPDIGLAAGFFHAQELHISIKPPIPGPGRAIPISLNSIWRR
jgi:hypothetical protein